MASETGPARASRSRAKSAATRRRVMDAAATLLVQRGYASTRLSDIAEAAGMQAGSLYYHFESKEQLVEEVLRHGVQFAHAHVRVAVEGLPDSASPGERLAAAVDGFLEATLELGDISPAHIRSFDQLPDTMQERIRPMRRAFARYWQQLVAAAIESGEIRSDVDPYVMQVFIINALERVVDLPPRSRRSTTELAATMRSLIFDGLGGPG